MKVYQKELISLMLKVGALSFGEFTLKSGRISPYFVNTGTFRYGSSLSQLGRAYAKHILECKLDNLECLFGPAYKGIPLAVAAASALFTGHGREVRILFDRKEAKDHGDMGQLVGGPLNPGEKVVIVDDVITAGTTLRPVIPFLRSSAHADVRAVVVLLDRCEKGAGSASAIQEVQSEFGVNVYPMLTIYDILSYLSDEESGELKLPEAMQRNLSIYLETYGVKP